MLIFYLHQINEINNYNIPLLKYKEYINDTNELLS